MLISLSLGFAVHFLKPDANWVWCILFTIFDFNLATFDSTDLGSLDYTVDLPDLSLL